MARADLVLLHAPSVYDFRETSIMYGPVSDMVPSTPVFEMYPIGLTTMAEYLERRGFHVRLVNLAVLMLKRPGFDVERAIREMDPVAFGIDLHWLPHAHGSIEIARIVKKHHPDTPVIFGGMTSSYYHEELASYPCVDYVVRGDSTEEPMVRLMAALRGRGSVSDVPNLTWKAADGSINVNELSWVPDDMDAVSLDFSYSMRSVIRSRDMVSCLPFKDFLKYPVCAALTSRGCTRNCVTCGGSATAFRKYFGRDKPAFRDPQLLVRDIAHIQRYIPGPVFVLNDPLTAGEDYARELIEGIGALNMGNPIAFEFFGPPPDGWWRFMDSHLGEWSAEISMESHDDDVRAAFGKRYTAAALEDSIEDAFANGCSRFDLYFMTGLPTQTADSVLATVPYVEALYERIGRPELLTFLSPMAPTLDPGSMVFDDPDRFGYTLRARTLEEHRHLLIQPSWKYILNYESDAMTRDELVDATYEAAVGITRAKARAGAVGRETAALTEARIIRAREAMELIDEIVEGDPVLRSTRLAALKEEFERLSESTVCEKKELNWPARVRLGMVVNVLALWFRETLSHAFRRFRTPVRSGFERTEA